MLKNVKNYPKYCIIAIATFYDSAMSDQNKTNFIVSQYIMKSIIFENSINNKKSQIMKTRTFTLFITLIFLGLFTFAQVPRDKVVLEIVTGTWCYYCPGAAMGAEDLIANGKDVVVIEYHNGDPYTNSWGSARQSYYGITGIPTAKFDGIVTAGGGNHTQSLYNTYLPKYNQRIAIPSPFTIDFEGSNSGMVDYEIDIEIEKVSTCSSSNLVMHFVLTESHIQQSWQGMSTLEWVERLMIPNQLGTALDFSSSNTNNVTINFTMDPTWVNDNCEIAIWIQDPGTKEIFQGTKGFLEDFGSTNTHDASIKNVYSPKTACNGSMEPKAFIANYGTENLTSLDLIYHVNDEDEYTYAWTGNLAYLETEMVELPGFDYSVLASNEFTVVAENPNGQPDQVPFNNIVINDFEAAQNVSSPVILALKLDDNPGETSWEVLSSDGTVLYSGGNYTTAGQFIIEEFDVPDQGCYTFIIYDEGGDGLTGSGIYKLAHDGNTIFAQGIGFGHQDETQFGINLTNTNETAIDAAIQIYPNPFEGQAFVSFTIEKAENINLNMYNSLGEVVYHIDNTIYPAGGHAIEINSTKFNSGIYFVHLTIGDQTYVEKVLHSK